MTKEAARGVAFEANRNVAFRGWIGKPITGHDETGRVHPAVDNSVHSHLDMPKASCRKSRQTSSPRVEAVETNDEYCGAAVRECEVTFGDHRLPVWTDAGRRDRRSARKRQTRMETGFA